MSGAEARELALALTGVISHVVLRVPGFSNA
jgi:hypothetical protein